MICRFFVCDAFVSNYYTVLLSNPEKIDVMWLKYAVLFAILPNQAQIFYKFVRNVSSHSDLGQNGKN
jgi:hypothetical protein